MIVCQFRTFSYVGNDNGFEENGAELKYLVTIRWFVFMLLTQNKYLLIIVWILMASLGTLENCLQNFVFVWKRFKFLYCQQVIINLVRIETQNMCAFFLADRERVLSSFSE